MSQRRSRDRAGDDGGAEERFEALWCEHAGAVLRYARRRVPPEEAEDVLAETFVVAWRRLDDAPGYALPWLLGIARRTAANALRGRRRRSALHERVAAQPATTTTHDPAKGHGNDAAAALAGLRERDRELLTLIAWDGLGPAEAAQVLGCSSGALAVRLHRARARFAAALHAQIGEDDGESAPARPVARPGLSPLASATPRTEGDPS